jgi:hypothetical protein
MIKCLLQFLSQTQLDCNSFLLNKTIRDSFPPQLEIEADGITSWIDEKGEKRTDGLVPDPPLYKVATSITFQNVWDHFSLFSTQQKFLVTLGDRFGRFNSRPRHTQKRRNLKRSSGIW